MSVRPCINCGQLVRNASRCSNCQRPNPASRGYDHRWQATRQAFLHVNPTCERCNQPAEHVHHIDGLGPRGPNGHDWGNLEALCASCHNQHTARQQPRNRL